MEDIRKYSGPKPSEYMQRFLVALPANKRRDVSSVLSNLRKHLHDVIPAKASSKQYVALLHHLSESFSLIPLHMRKNMKSHLLDGLAVSLPTSSTSFSLFTICLCIIELSALRNADRLDLESQDVLETITRLNATLLPNLSDHVLAQRTNLPSLYAWALCILVFSFQACGEWLCANHCYSDAFASRRNILQFNRCALDHPSVPPVMKFALCLQRKRSAFPVPPKPYSLFDLLFSCAVSGNHTLLATSYSSLRIHPSVCLLEASEPPASLSSFRATPNRLNSCFPSSNLEDIKKLTPETLRELLNNGNVSQVISCLQSFKRAMMQLSGDHDSLTHHLVTTLKSTTQLLVRIYSESASDYSTYENAFYILVHLWSKAAEQRTLLKSLPQSYLWLAVFMHPHYESMSQSGFMRAVICLARLLTSYQSLFRSSILDSPHWYLQMITDIVVAVIDRLEKAQDNQPDELEEAMCICIVAISRPLAALHIDKPDIRVEFSRVLKMSLETIVSRMASCHSARRSVDKTAVGDATDKPMLGLRTRELIYHYLLFPIIRAADPYALSQARIGIRPAAAKILWDQLVTQVIGEPDGDRVLSKLGSRKTPAALGGLHVAVKLAIKRRR
ncbi:unnamed protein product [Dicrocoelium dendriticum]|nr:unnamed protein product [Dicrocoelium dendriticum]